MSTASALIVDDEEDILELVTITLSRMAINVHSVTTLQAARQALTERSFDFCLTDMRLPDGDGTELVKYASEHYPQMPIAMATAYGNMDSAVAAMKAGAFDFVSKPLDLRILRGLTTAALQLRATETAPATQVATQPISKEQALLGCSAAIQSLRQLIAKLARNQAPVFINGESGTGKELVARLIHHLGPRSTHPFIPVNCGAIPAELVESELFGHCKGSFTGATHDKPGLFQSAQGGTLFLDEIADLPLPMQVKLLRAIQQKSVRPLGSAQEIPVDARIVSASHKNLEQEVARGTFRQDLFYRINVIDLFIPPLRQRPEDIPVLTEYLLPRIAQTSGNPCRTLSPAALQHLQGYHFPGNVRELENILERASALGEHSIIEPEDLHLPNTNNQKITTESPTTTITLDPSEHNPLASRLSQLERHMLLQTLQEMSGDHARVAQCLGLTLRSLEYRLQRLGLATED
jgi:two-component system response regulator PilR (NtrC family)